MKYVNQAGWDRIVRIIIGIVLLALTFTGTVSGALGIVLMIVGFIALLTGIIGVCPAYMLFKVRTNKG
jgi:hypothetical protein